MLERLTPGLSIQLLRNMFKMVLNKSRGGSKGVSEYMLESNKQNIMT